MRHYLAICLIKFMILIAFTATITNAVFDDTLSRDTFFRLALAARADYTQICLANILPRYRLDMPFVVPCDMPGSPIGHPDVTCKAITAIDDDNHIIAIVFRGTTSQQQFIEENTTNTVSYLGTHVHEYFYYGFSHLMLFGLQNRINVLHNAYPDYKFYVTGHSLGAAMASLLATTLRQNIPPLDVTYITYGEPRVGLQDYASLFSNSVIDPYRVTHAADPVPHLPPMLALFQHGGSEIWYNNTMIPNSPYTLCTVDNLQSINNQDCSNSMEPYIYHNQTTFASTLIYHDTYYDYNMTDFAAANCTDSEFTPAPTTSNPNPTCPTGWNQSQVIHTRCYKFETIENNWFAALETCKAYGGSLTSIDNAFINSNIRTLGKDWESICPSYYIGLFKNGTVWEWINGDNSNYVNWKSGDPNTERNDLCALMDMDSGAWENQDCSRPYCYICEKILN